MDSHVIARARGDRRGGPRPHRGRRCRALLPRRHPAVPRRARRRGLRRQHAEEVAAILRLRHRPRHPGRSARRRLQPVRGDRGRPHGGIVLVLTRTGAHPGGQPGRAARPGTDRRDDTSRSPTRPPTPGLLYAPDPGSRTVSTIGGNVATCAGGLRGLKYGVTRNYVLGARRGPAHRRDHPHRRPTLEGRRRLRPDPAADRIGGHARGASPKRPSRCCRRRPTAVPASRTSTRSPTPARAVAAVIGAGIVPATLEFLDRKCIAAVEQYAALGLRERRRGAAAVRRRRGSGGGVERNLDPHRGGLPGGRGRWRSPSPRTSPVPRHCSRPAAARCRRCPGSGR